MLGVDFSLSSKAWDRFHALTKTARELGYTLKRNGDYDLPFRIIQRREVVYETHDLDAIADWLS